MRGTLRLFPLYAFVARTGTALPLSAQKCVWSVRSYRQTLTWTGLYEHVVLFRESEVIVRRLLARVLWVGVANRVLIVGHDVNWQVRVTPWRWTEFAERRAKLTGQFLQFSGYEFVESCRTPRGCVHACCPFATRKQSFSARSLVGGSEIHVLRGSTKRKYAVLAEDRIPVARSTLFPLLIRHPFQRLFGNCFLCQKLSSKEVCFTRCLIRKRRRRQIPAVSHSLCTNTCAQWLVHCLCHAWIFRPGSSFCSSCDHWIPAIFSSCQGGRGWTLTTHVYKVSDYVALELRVPAMNCVLHCQPSVYPHAQVQGYNIHELGRKQCGWCESDLVHFEFVFLFHIWQGSSATVVDVLGLDAPLFVTPSSV
jgi:hypothetical protein